MDTQTAMIEEYYKQGHSRVIITRESGVKETLRLFTSTYGALGYKAKGKQRRGYSVSDLTGITAVKPVNEKKLTPREKYLDNLKRFKVTFTRKCHPNLWGNLQTDYKSLDITAFEQYVTEHKPDENSGLSMYDCLRDFCKQNGDINPIMENRYKTTTITSNKPSGFDSHVEGYTAYLQNIKGHLDCKEDFHYYWRGSYDVSVSGKMCDYGDSPKTGYKAWLSLEFKGCGNGHYYLLVNENLAVFAEDD